MLIPARPSFGTDYVHDASGAIQPSLWNGLALLYAPILGHQGGQIIDVSGYKLHASVRGATYIPQSQGLGLLTDTGTEGVLFTAPARLKPTDNVSLVWYGRWIGTPDADTPMVGITNSNADTFPYVSYILDLANPSTKMRFNTAHGGSFAGAIQSGTLSQGVDYVVIGTGTSGRLSLYINGRLDNTNTSTSGAIAYTGTSQLVLGCHHAVTTRVLNAVCYLAAIYTRVLTPTEILQIGADPLLLLRQRSTRHYAVVTTTIPQLSRPNADTTVDNWTDFAGGTTAIYATLDDLVGDTSADADGIQSQLSPTSDVYVAPLSTTVDPSVSSGYVLRYRYGKSAAGGQQVNLTVQLIKDYVSEGTPGTVIASAVHTDIGVFPIAGTLTLSEAECDAITDHAALSVRFLANAP